MKTVLQYIMIVGISLLALMGILEIGENLKAPDDISGKWKLISKNYDGQDNSCFPELKTGSDFLIEQSGIYLILLSKNSSIKLEGRIDGTLATFYGVLSRSSSTCENSTQLEMKTRIRQRQNSVLLAGRLYRPGCSDCGEIKFSAEKHHTFERTHP